jgi:hypothetical protein
MSAIGVLCAAIGAMIVIGMNAIAGYRLHRLIEERAPGIGALLPTDTGVWLGILAGVAMVASWC